jgi:tetratricopeptide (TPR) repeat protein
MGPPTSDELIARARKALADAYLRTGDYDAVDGVVEEAGGAARAAADRRAEAEVLALEGMTLHFRAIELSPEERVAIDHGPEQRLFERALARRREVGDTEGVAESLFQLGLVQQVLRRDLEAGAPLFREALAVVEAVPDADLLLRSEIHRHVGFDLLLREERPDDALRHLRASYELRTQLPEQGWLGSALVALSMGARLAGDRDDALDYARRAVELATSEGLRERHVKAGAGALDAAEEMPY